MNKFSIDKASLTPDNLSRLTDRKTLRKTIDSNLGTALETDVVQLRQGIFDLDYSKIFTLDGSIKVKTDPKQGIFSEFYSKPGRISTKGDDFILHGPRYLTSVDPTLVVSQKLKNFEEDFLDALETITTVNAYGGGSKDFLEYAGVLDYLKNSVVSILNALLQEEKLGLFKLDNQEYQNFRQQLVELAISSVRAFYFHLIGEVGLRDVNLSQVTSNYEVYIKTSQYILDKYRSGIFSARYFTRPESTHPLLILASAVTSVNKAVEVPDTIIGLPSGGTELSIIQRAAFEYLNAQNTTLVLVPLSLHSIKDAFGVAEVSDSGFKDYLSSVSNNISGKNIVLVEDNSSTGRTVQKMHDLLIEAGAKSVAVFISEADVVRSEIDIGDMKRRFITASEAYHGTVNILPISKHIIPKVDLREIAERRRLIKYNKEKQSMQNSEVEKFIAKVLAKMTEEPTETRLDKLNDLNSIQLFRATFLSNFYACEVGYGGRTYSSVEHGYQAQKFTDEELEKVKKTTTDEIHEMLRTRGVIKVYKSVKEIFADPYLASGNIKMIADILRTAGHVRKDWDERRAEVMATLLLQKYQNPELRDLLKGTGNKYLVEGNTWGDTLWGVSDGKGRNMLGQMLMVIRESL